MDKDQMIWKGPLGYTSFRMHPAVAKMSHLNVLLVDDAGTHPPCGKPADIRRDIARLSSAPVPCGETNLHAGRTYDLVLNNMAQDKYKAASPRRRAFYEQLDQRSAAVKSKVLTSSRSLSLLRSSGSKTDIEKAQVDIL